MGSGDAQGAGSFEASAHCVMRRAMRQGADAYGIAAASGGSGNFGPVVGAGASAAGASAGAASRKDDANGASVFSAASSARLVITMMLMRRLIGFIGSLRSKSTDEASPTMRADLAASSPPACSARRAALARSAESSQFEYELPR